MTKKDLLKGLPGLLVVIVLLAASSDVMAFCYYQNKLANYTGKTVEIDWTKYRVRGSTFETLLFSGRDVPNNAGYQESTANLSTECANYDFMFKVRWRCSGGSWQISESYYKNAEGSYWDGNYTTITGYLEDCDDSGHVYYRYPGWGDREPNNAGNEDCAVSRSDGFLNDADCGKTLPFACKNGSGEWHITSQSSAWIDGFAACSDEGRIFARHVSYSDNQSLKSAKSAAGVAEVWLNHQDIETEGDWTYASYSESVRYEYGARIWGGGGGSEYNDMTILTKGLLQQTPRRIFKIGLRSGARVDQVSIEYDNGEVVSHGGSGGNAQWTGALLSTTTLQQVEVCEDYTGKHNSNTVHYIKFTLSSGYTMSGGTRRGECVTLKSNLGYPILGFRGNSGAELDSFGIIIEKPAVSNL